MERLASIWQAIHRDEKHSWLANASDRELALFPFRQSEGRAAENMWTADMLRDHETLGYTYEDIQGTKDEMRKRFKDMYDWSIYHPDKRRDCEVKAPANSESSYLFINHILEVQALTLVFFIPQWSR